MGIKCPKCQHENPDDTIYCGKCAAPLKPTRDIAVTETIEVPKHELARGTIFANRYEIIEELGKGGMGRVYRAYDKQLEEEVAIKLIKSEIAADKKTLDRFKNEIKLARKVIHRNVCRMHDLHEEKDIKFITMEYVAGEDLKSQLRRMGKVPIEKAVFIAHQIADGLSEAHRLGVIHRDLKPHNVMIDKEGNARIMDFGIARSLGGRELTGEGVIIGTPDYMSPEQAEGKGADARSDIYSLGVILYEMVTGQVPFEGETPFSVAMKHKTEAPLPPKKLNPQLPDDLNRLILCCLEKEPVQRYQTTEDFLSDLTRIEEQGLPTPERITPKRKPTVSREITVKFTPKKLAIPAIGIIALIVIAILVWRFIPKKQYAPPFSGKPSLAILYFDNLSEDKSLDPWENGLTELLITKLSQSKFIDVLDGNTIYSILKKLNLEEIKKYTKEDLIKVANEGGSTHTLSGSIMKAGQNIIITLSLQRPQAGRVVSSIPIECRGEEEIIPKVDEVAIKIKSDLDLTPEQISGDIDKELSKITTASPEAFKYYSQARAFLKELNYEQSIALMEKAIALDPEFAMAYRSLAAAYRNLSNPTKRKEYIQKAFELNDHISERERYLIQGDYYRESEKTYDKAIEAYTKLVELYPDETTGLANLGNIYDDLEEWDKALERFEAITKRNVPGFISYSNTAIVYAKKGLYEKAVEILEDYAKNFSDNPILRERLSSFYASQRKYDLSLNEANKAFALAPTNNRIRLHLAQIYLLKGDFQEAEREFQIAAESGPEIYISLAKAGLALLYLLEGKIGRSKEQIQQGLERSKQAGEKLLECRLHDDLCSIFLTSDDFASALKEIERIWEYAVMADDFSWQRIALWKKGLAYAGMNSIDKAQDVADELKEFIEKGINKKVLRLYHHLQGAIELKKNNYSLGIEYLNKAVSSLSAQTFWTSFSNALFYDTLASAYLKSGDLENAQKQYETIISLTWGRYYWGDIYAKSFYMLGKIYEEQGDKSKAIEHYQKFLSLWKDADPGLPEVDDAIKRLASLQK